MLNETSLRIILPDRYSYRALTNIPYQTKETSLTSGLDLYSLIDVRAKQYFMA